MSNNVKATRELKKVLVSFLRIEKQRLLTRSLWTEIPIMPGATHVEDGLFRYTTEVRYVLRNVKNVITAVIVVTLSSCIETQMDLRRFKEGRGPFVLGSCAIFCRSQ